MPDVDYPFWQHIGIIGERAGNNRPNSFKLIRAKYLTYENCLE
jgi:hypothetical protein